MSERKSVTREELLAAIRPLFDGPESVHLDRLGWWDGDILAVTPRDLAGRIFDALPATPAASGDVDAAWEALLRNLAEYAEHRLPSGATAIERAVARQLVASHRHLIEAAIRAESAGTLDVERLARAIDSFITSQTGFDVDDAHAIAAEYARLAEDADKPS